jgi:hypothetical protein
MLFPKTKSNKTFAQTQTLLIGWPKTGKSTLASYLNHANKSPLFIMTEAGEGTLEISKARVSDLPGLIKLIDMLDLKKKEAQEQYCCFVIDLITDIDTWCGEYVAKQNGVAHVSDLTFGKGFGLQKEEFRKQVSRLMAILPCFFIAHPTEKEVNIQGTVVKVQAPALSKGAMEFLNGKVDTIAFIKPGSGKEPGALVIEPGLLAITGSRYKSIIGQHTFDGTNGAEVLAKLEKLFNGETK